MHNDFDVLTPVQRELDKLSLSADIEPKQQNILHFDRDSGRLVATGEVDLQCRAVSLHLCFNVSYFHKEVQPCNHNSVWSRSEINYSFRQQTRVINPDAPHWNYDR